VINIGGFNMEYVDSSSLWKNRAAWEQMQTHYDSELANLTVPYQAQYIDTRYGKTYVISAGDSSKMAMLLWHGMNANATMWIQEMNMYAQDYFVVVPDALGSSGRSSPKRLDRKTMQYGEWAADVLAALNISQAIHLGISGGGWQILKLANIVPEAIRAAILMSSGGFYDVNKWIVLRMLPSLILSPFLSARKTAYRFIKIMSPPNHEPSEGELDMFELIFNFNSEQGVPALPDEQIGALTAPTMLLMGEYEMAFKPPERVIERAKKTLPKLIHAEVLADVSHGMHGDNPDLVHGKIREFLKQLDL
jgi:pimeloyl-ACP methyl ester carboxylesterase